MNTTTQPGPLEVRLSDLLGPDFVPAAWQERQKLTNGDQWTHWYECQPFPRSAQRDFMIGMITAQRRILQTDDQAMTAINAAIAAERERWAKRVEEAFYEGFTSPETYNDTLQNSADEAWAKAKASLLKA